MENLSQVMEAVLRAIGFIWKNKRAFLLRAGPIVIFMLALDLISWYAFTELFSIRAIIDPFIYAIFVVSWHRYTILPSERASKAFPLKFGVRELKFGAIAFIVSSLAALVFGALVSNVPQALTIPIAIVAAIWIIVSLIFVYPAIALDQPVRQMLFFKKGMRLIPSLAIAIGLCLIIFFVGLKPVYFLLSYIEDSVSQNQAFLLRLFFHNGIEVPIFLAIAASTASLLFKDIIGIEPDDPSVSEESKPS